MKMEPHSPGVYWEEEKESPGITEHMKLSA